MIYHKVMANMKYTLELEEYSYREMGRNDPKYKTFKKHLMSNTYDNLRELFEEMASLGIVKKTDDNEDPKGGYRETLGGGSGYVNSPDFDKWMERQEEG